MENAISVSQVNNYIKSIFDAEFMLQNIFVYGEIGSYKVTNGIAYFNLKDETSLISCVLFGANNFPEFEVGSQVVVRGSVNYYSKGGKLNFNAVSIERYGLGVLYQKFLELKAELEALGYFDEANKKPLPERVKRIGVVTSETGAVIRDIIDVTRRRNDSVDIVLYPVKVQGLGAEKEIANGIDFFSNYDKVDVVIVARGGGSMEDLQPYNTRIVADATYRCNKPVVSAVGHETDFTIIDFVSDLRAPTPSAGAELVTTCKSDEINMLNSVVLSGYKSISTRIEGKLRDAQYIYSMLDNVVDLKLRNGLQQMSKGLVDLERRLLDKIAIASQNISEIKAVIRANDIKTISEKGYVKVYCNGKVLKSVEDVDDGELITVDLLDGSINAEIRSKEKRNGIR